MKKSVVMMIAIIYIASIVVVSLFGMKISVYNEDIPVTQILCTNKTDAENNVQVIDDDGERTIKIKFVESANAEKLTGTMLYIEHRVLPDNATNKIVKYVYSENQNVEFYKDTTGAENGLILFHGKAIIDVTIMSTDLRKISTKITIWAY